MFLKKEKTEPVKITVWLGLDPHNSIKCTESPILKLGCPQNTTQG